MLQDRPMSNELIRIGAPIAILAVGIGGFLLLSRLSTKKETQEPRDKTPIVETVSVKVHNGGLTIEANGVVVPYREITLSAQVAGNITLKADQCRAGKYVAKGKVLLQIDPQDYELDVRKADGTWFIRGYSQVFGSETL